MIIYLNAINVGWLDDALFIQREAEKRGGSSSAGLSGECDNRRNVLWNNFSSHHAFTTGRQPRPGDANFGSKVRPKGPSQTLKVSLNVCKYYSDIIQYAFGMSLNVTHEN